MAKLAANIVVGAPSVVTVGSYGAGKGSGVDVGATVGPVVVRYDDTIYEKKADQWLGPVGAVKTEERMTVEIPLAERSLANLALALGYPTGAVSGSTLEMGGNATVTERECFIDGVSPSGGTTQITIKKCVVLSAGFEYGLQRDGQTIIKLTLLVLQDTSKTANQQLIQIADSGGDTTAPTIAMTTPAEDGTVTAGTKDTLTLTFTEADTRIDESTLIYGDADKATIFVNDVEDPTATSLVAGTISYNAATKVLTFTPTSNWAAATENYQIIITTGVRDIAGNYLASVFFGHFTSA